MDEIIKTVSETLEKEEDVLALFLFGSRARNENNKDSDYDFYVILDKNAKDSLREDEIYKKIHEATKGYKPEIHLTFQYLFIVNDDKSLILKISSEGRLIFSKAYLIAPYGQFGLQRYFICKWQIDEKRFNSGNKNEFIMNSKLLINKFVRNNKLLINRMLYGYVQKYVYNDKAKESKKGGLIDNKIVFGEGELIIVPDIFFDHVNHFIEKDRGKIKILGSCYIPISSIEEIDKYYGKKELERFIKKDKKIGKELFVTSIAPFDLDKIDVKFEQVGDDKRYNTQIQIKTLPEEIQPHIIIKRRYKFI